MSYIGASPKLVEIGSWSDYIMKIAEDKTRLCPRGAANAKYLVNIPYKRQGRWARGQPGLFSHQPPEHFLSLLLFSKLSIWSIDLAEIQIMRKMRRIHRDTILNKALRLREIICTSLPDIRGSCCLHTSRWTLFVLSDQTNRQNTTHIVK